MTARRFGIASNAIATAASTVVINASSALVAVLIAQRLGRSAQTDGFFLAYAGYLVLTLGAAALRILLVPTFTRAEHRGTLRGEIVSFALALALPCLLLLAAAVAAGVGAGGTPTRDAFAHAVPWLAAAGVLQIYGGLATSVLATRDEYVVPALAYAAGSVASLALFAALPGHGLDPLLVVARSTAVPVALQALYAIATAFAAGIGTGDATVFNYAFFLASFLVAATSTPLALVSSGPLARRGLADGEVATHVVSTAWLSLAVIAGAVGIFTAVGPRVLSGALGDAYSGAPARDIVETVLALVPWIVVSVGVTVAYPLVFVRERERLVFVAAVGIPLAELACAWPLRSALGLPGLALSVAIPTAAALALFVRSVSPHELRLVAVGLGRVAVLLTALAALTFGAPRLVSGGIPSAVVGAALYAAGLAAVWRNGPRAAWLYFRAIR